MEANVHIAALLAERMNPSGGLFELWARRGNQPTGDRAFEREPER